LQLFIAGVRTGAAIAVACPLMNGHTAYLHSSKASTCWRHRRSTLGVKSVLYYSGTPLASPCDATRWRWHCSAAGGQRLYMAAACVTDAAHNVIWPFRVTDDELISRRRRDVKVDQSRR